MCPLIDCRILNAFLDVTSIYDTRSDWAPQRVMNKVAVEYAALCSAINVPRVDNLVFDYVPLIHMDSRTIDRAKKQNISSCQRKNLDRVKLSAICMSHIKTWDTPLHWCTLQNHTTDVV